MAAELIRRGVDAWELLEEIDVNAASLANSLEVVSQEKFARFLERAQAKTQEPSLGLAAGRAMPFSAMLGIGPMLLACETLRAAFELLVEHSQGIVHGSEWSLTESGRFSTVEFDLKMADDAAARQLDELMMILLYRIGRHFVSDQYAQDCTIFFAHFAARSPSDGYRSFRSPVAFSRPRSGLAFPTAWLDMPNLYVDPLASFVFSRNLQRVSEQRAGASWETRVRFAIRNSLIAAPFALSALAEVLRVSPRALRRKLFDEGTNVAAIVRSERQRLACHELRRSRASIKEVAYAAGFADQSSFQRAFKRWLGLTPTRFRNGDHA